MATSSIPGDRTLIDTKLRPALFYRRSSSNCVWQWRNACGLSLESVTRLVGRGTLEDSILEDDESESWLFDEEDSSVAPYRASDWPAVLIGNPIWSVLYLWFEALEGSKDLELETFLPLGDHAHRWQWGVERVMVTRCGCRRQAATTSAGPPHCWRPHQLCK